MRLEDLVISQSEAINNPNYLILRDRLRDLSRLRQARKNVSHAKRHLDTAKQVYRSELNHCFAKRYANLPI